MTSNATYPPLQVVLGDWQRDEAFHRAITTPVSLVAAPTLRDDDVVPLLADADAFITKRFTAAMGDAAKRLRLIHAPGAGTNEIDLAAVPDGAVVCNVYGHGAGIAEYVFMAILALNRDLLNMDARLRRGDWSDRTERDARREIRSRTLAMIGLGRIGVEVARLATAFGMRVIAATRTPNADRAKQFGLASIVGMDQLHAVLAEADFVVVAVSLDASTTGLIGSRELSVMKPSAYLVNVARGAIIDEGALYQALKDRTIAGAALDVWYQYPEANERVHPAKHPFHELDNVIMTPHIAGVTEETFRHRWAVINENLRRVAAGEPLLNVVYPSTGTA